MKTVILPKDNEKDFAELQSYISDGLNVHFVSHYSELYPIVFKHN